MNTKTDHLLLGLLSHEPMTGYDMKKRIDNPIGLFWQAGYGSINVIKITSVHHC